MTRECHKKGMPIKSKDKRMQVKSKDKRMPIKRKGQENADKESQENAQVKTRQ